MRNILKYAALAALLSGPAYAETITVPTGVIGPSSATSGHIATFSGTTGFLIQDGGVVPTSAPCSAFGTTTGTCIQGAGAFGTPSSLTLTNATSLPIGGISGLGTGVATLLGGTSSGTGGMMGTASPVTTGILTAAAITATTITATGALKTTLGGTTGALIQPATPTNAGWYQVVNTGSTLDIGIDDSAGSTFGTAGVYGTVIYRSAGTALAISRAGTVDLLISSAGAMKMPAYGAGTATFDASGNITSLSDPRLKNILGPYTGGLMEVLKLRPIIYTWKPISGMETNNKYAGFNCWNVRDNLALSTGVNPSGYCSLQDRAILAAVTNAVQQQQNQIICLAAALMLLTIFAALGWVNLFRRKAAGK